MKKTLIITGLIVIGLLLMEIATRVLFPDTPDVGRMTIDSLYKFPYVADRLGEATGYNVQVDSASDDKKTYYTSVRVTGASSDTTVKVSVTKIVDRWVINKLSLN